MLNSAFAKQQVSGGRGKVADGLAHCRQGWPDNAGQSGVIKTRNRKLLRNLNAAPMRNGRVQLPIGEFPNIALPTVQVNAAYLGAYGGALTDRWSARVSAISMSRDDSVRNTAPGAVEDFVDEVTHLVRSQVAAVIGNLALVVPGVLLLCGGLWLFTGHAPLSREKAEHVLGSLTLLGPTALFAAFTGVLLFSSSIVAGWVENWFVFHKLHSAMEHNPRFTRVLGHERAARWANFTRANISGLAANISLGFMLGLVPVFAQFFGLPIDVRHVTLSAGQVAAAAATLGLQVLAEPAFWWAVAGVVVVGPINLGVSFYLAFRLALKAQNINQVNRQRIRAEIRARIRSAPLSFLWPPREDSAAAPQTLPPQA